MLKIDTPCVKFVLFVCVQSAQPLIIEHLVSIAAMSKTSIKHKMLSVQEKLDIINTVNCTEHFPHKKML